MGLEEEEIDKEVWLGQGQGEFQRAATVHQGGHVYTYWCTWRLLATRAGAPVPSIGMEGPPPSLEGYRALLVEGRLSRRRTGPRWCTVAADIEYDYLPVCEDPLGKDPRRKGK